MAPENTLAAFRRALSDGADGVECDVRLAKDGVPVLFHDATLKRTAFKDGKLRDFTSKELGRIDVGSWFNLRHPERADRAYRTERIPTLAQFFELMKQNQKLIYVELKCKNENHLKLAEEVAILIRDFGLQKRTVVKSFEHEATRIIQKMLPDVRIAALFSPRPLRVIQPRKTLVTPALNLEADELSLHYTLATERTVKKATAAGMKTVIWTANHPAWVKRAFKLGIHGIITNEPARLIARREQLIARLKAKQG